jgi:HEAT repeat protein
LAMLRQKSSAPNVAIPALIAAMDDTDPAVSFHATQAFGFMGPDASNAVPALTKELVKANSVIATNPSAISFFYADRGAADALGKIGPSAVSALPELRKMLQITNADTDLRGTVAVAIWRISGDVDTTLPALLQEMSSQDEMYQDDWVAALGEMGPRAKPRGSPAR